MLGTVASLAGGGFIGLIFWIYQSLVLTHSDFGGYAIIYFGGICGVLGSLIDSILGATLQATYYSNEKKSIIKRLSHQELKQMVKNPDKKSVERICGVDVLSNEAVNFISILLTMLLSFWISPWIFRMNASL